MIYQFENERKIIGLYLAEDDIHDKIKIIIQRKIQNLSKINLESVVRIIDLFNSAFF
jgi:predicted secreted Zn-dependent protease